MTKASDVAAAAPKYLGRKYSEMDCQAFVEKCLEDAGMAKNLAGSNAWYRAMTWTGSPEECVRIFGCVPVGAFLFILKQDGGEPGKYKSDGIGNASHIGIYTCTGKGAVHSSASKGMVCESAFNWKTIPNGGWNRVGLLSDLSYGDHIDKILGGGKMPVFDDPITMVVYRSQEARAGSSTVNVRSGPTVANSVLFKIPFDTMVEAYEENGGFTRIKCAQGEGYIMSSFLTAVGMNGNENPADLIEEIKFMLNQLEKLIVKG